MRFKVIQYVWDLIFNLMFYLINIGIKYQNKKIKIKNEKWKYMNKGDQLQRWTDKHKRHVPNTYHSFVELWLSLVLTVFNRITFSFVILNVLFPLWNIYCWAVCAFYFNNYGVCSSTSFVLFCFSFSFLYTEMLQVKNISSYSTKKYWWNWI